MARQPTLEGNEKGIAPHVAVVDNSKRDDGTFSRKAFIYDKGQDINMCPSRKRSSGTLVNGGATLLYRASNPCHCSNQQFSHTQRDRKKVEILFSHLKRIPRLGGLRPRRPIQSAVFRDAVNLSTRRLKTPERRDYLDTVLVSSGGPWNLQGLSTTCFPRRFLISRAGERMLTEVKLRELIRKAESATPGPWAVNPQDKVNVQDRAQHTIAVCSGPNEVADHEYIVAANPAVVSELARACLEMREVLKFYGGMESKYGQTSWFRSRLVVDQSVGLMVNEEGGTLARTTLAKHFRGERNRP